MKIVIIEDEKITARDLANTLEKLFPEVTVLKIIGSVREGLAYFAEEREVAIIFADIQLGDGTSFEIFSAMPVKSPVIFCTAYDEYALEAFSANGIDYILKPFTDETVRSAVDKYLSLTQASRGPSFDMQELQAILDLPRKTQAASILVFHQDKILPIPIEDAAYFYYSNGMVSVTTFNNSKYPVSKTMDEIGKMTAPVFFRANRQFLINRAAIREVTNYLSRKLSVRLTIEPPEDITVSREKMTSFLDWLSRY